MKKKSNTYDQVLEVIDRRPVEVLRLRFDTNGDWAPMVPDDVVIRTLGGKFYIMLGSDLEGPFMSLKKVLDTEYFNVPTPNACLSSRVLPHKQLLKIAYSIADWDNEEERLINDIRVNRNRYKVANRKLVLIEGSEPSGADRLKTDETRKALEFKQSGTLLLSMPLEYRIEAVWKDVDSRADRFRSIDPMELANALEVPFESLRDSDWSSDWGCFKTIEEVSIEGLVQEGYSMGELVELLDGKIDSERIVVLTSGASEFDDDKSTTFDFLTADERGIIESYHTERRLEDDDGKYICCHNVETLSGEVLQFHVTDNGYEYNVIATPYDVRDEPTFFDDSVHRQV